MHGRNIPVLTLLLCQCLGATAGFFLAAPVAADQPSCGVDGEFALDATTVGAYEAAQFSAQLLLAFPAVEPPYCAALTLRGATVDADVVHLDLHFGASDDPAACPPITNLEGTLPPLGPGTYTVQAALTYDENLEPTCVLGTETLTVLGSNTSSMLDNSNFDRGLDAWSTVGSWIWEGDAARAETVGELSQCVPVSALEQYRLVASAQGVGAHATLGLSAVYSYGVCPSDTTLALDEIIVEVGTEDLEQFELVLSPPSGNPSGGPEPGANQLYARIVASNEDDGVALRLDSLRLERVGCGEGGDTVGCAHGGRFEVRLAWEDFSATSGPAHLVTAANDSSLWWFFRENNWEMLVKVLRGCPLGGHWWVFSAGATNVAWTLTVDDTSTGNTWSHTNPLGERPPAITDTSALTCAEAE